MARAVRAISLSAPKKLSLRIGENKVMIAGPFAEKVSPVPSGMEEIFFSTASDEVTGEFDNVKVSIAPPKMRA